MRSYGSLWQAMASYECGSRHHMLLWEAMTVYELGAFAVVVFGTDRRASHITKLEAGVQST
ncbi:hypothetical protein B0H12DRAFT_1090989 [Mycena haematopus]|nr:hypothetical protein B0H12DRAFT_1090989 [Mycena haematopus]